MSLALKYAPKTLDDVIGQDKAVAQLRLIESRTGLSGRAFWFTGTTGTGKTSLVNVCAAMGAGVDAIRQIDASKLTMSEIADVEAATRTRSLPFDGKTGWSIIVNEAHGLRADSIRQLLDTLERIPPHVAWFFTTTNDGNDATMADKIDGAPLIGRCIPINLSRTNLASVFAKHALAIARLEGLATKDNTIKQFEKLAYECKLSLRMMFSVIESGKYVV